MTGVCTPWVTGDDLTWPDGVTAPTDADLIEAWCRFASDVLYALSGELWPGVCTDVVRPCAQYRVVDLSTRQVIGTWLPGAGGTTSGFWPGDRGELGFCSCNRSARTGNYSLPEIRLAGPIIAITTVKIDGQVVPPNEYQVADDRYLVGLTRPDGSRREWPCCQRMDLPDTAEGTWSVAYTYGPPTPTGGVKAAAALAVQCILAEIAPAKCKLPDRTKTVVRQGVTISRYEPSELFPNGLVGISVADLWLSSLQIAERRRGGRVMVPGRRRRVRRTR